VTPADGLFILPSPDLRVVLNLPWRQFLSFANLKAVAGTAVGTGPSSTRD